MPIAGGILLAGTSTTRCLDSAAGMLRFLARLSGRRRHVRRSSGPGARGAGVEGEGESVAGGGGGERNGTSVASGGWDFGATGEGLATTTTTAVTREYESARCRCRCCCGCCDGGVSVQGQDAEERTGCYQVHMIGTDDDGVEERHQERRRVQRHEARVRRCRLHCRHRYLRHRHHRHPCPRQRHQQCRQTQDVPYQSIPAAATTTTNVNDKRPNEREDVVPTATRTFTTTATEETSPTTTTRSNIDTFVTAMTRGCRIPPYLATLLILSYAFFGMADACSSRSTPKPRPPTPTPRPNITFHMYSCPPDYAEWYCLNGATCFTVKIVDSLLYNCLCANGYIGQRCEFKDLDGSYLPSRQRALLVSASIASGVAFAVFAVVICIAFYVHYRRKQKKLRTSSNCVDTVDGPGRDPELRPFCNRTRSLMIFMAKNPNPSTIAPSIEQTRMPDWKYPESTRMASISEGKRPQQQVTISQ